jgi:hypothetical protein
MSFERAFINESCNRLNQSMSKIKHCFSQLDEGHIWIKPNHAMNSIGIIVNHLCGNVRQWIIYGIGGLKDIRVRYKEFEDDERSSKNVLLKAISGVIEDAKKVLQSIDENSLLDARRIQGFDETVITAIYGTVSHFELHVGQILYASRFFLGDRYVLSWKPETREQGLK